jgi:hypothetical protein
MQALAAQEKWTAGWVFDGRKNLYSPEAFLPQNETTFEVSHSFLLGQKQKVTALADLQSKIFFVN